MKVITGWIYDKSGNVREIQAPVNSNLVSIVSEPTTVYGQIPSSVGCATNKWNYNSITGKPARGIDLRKH